jgi:hypothetical protein
MESSVLPRTLLRRALQATTFATALALAGCAVEPPAGEPDGDEPTDQSDDAVVSGSVSHAASVSCSTASVKPLSQQIIAEMNCISPGSVAKIPKRPNLVVSSAVFPYLVTPAKNALVASLNAHPGTKMHLNSAFRTVAQQYLLYRWYQTGRCGIGLAAHPGLSNHETGLALDVQETSTWRSSLKNHGFHWFGSSDSVHYDYYGASSKRGLDVKAFQRLWNRNHPGDKIAVDGDYGPQTEARIKKSPANGFAKGATCGGSSGQSDEDLAPELEVDDGSDSADATDAPEVLETFEPMEATDLLEPSGAMDLLRPVEPPDAADSTEPLNPLDTQG